MDAKIKELLIRLSFFAEDGMADKPIVEIAKQAEALLMEAARKPNTQHPVAQITGGKTYMSVELLENCPADLPNGAQPYLSPPVPRDVLMAFGAAVRDAAKRADFDIGEDVDIEAIADRYAGKVQPEPVNQPAAVLDVIEHLQLAETEVTNAKAWSAGEQAKTHCKYALTAIAVARSLLSAAQPVAQQYLLGGRRFKVTHSQDHGFAITGLPQTMNGQWVAFVDATDNCHMQQQQPASAQQVAVPDEMTPAMMRAVQLRSELGAYSAANLSGAYDLFAEFWRVEMEEAKKGGAA